jgi:DNA-binding NarL/FixJ family response regulator
VRIVLVDDHPLIRSGLATTLSSNGFEIVGEAASVTEGLAVINSTNPQLCIVDINLGAGSGIDLIKMSTATNSVCKFVVLTMHDDIQTLEAAKSAGASAYVTKGSAIEGLVEVIKSIMEYKSSFLKVGDIRKPVKKRDFKLTQRELQVLSLLPSGATAAVIGSMLFLTEATIKTHLAAIYRKLNASNRAQAVSIAISEDLIPQQ